MFTGLSEIREPTVHAAFMEDDQVPNRNENKISLGTIKILIPKKKKQ